MYFSRLDMCYCNASSLFGLSFCYHNWVNFPMFLVDITCIIFNWIDCIQTIYKSHHNSIGPLNVSNATSTCYLQSWHETWIVITLVNKIYASSCNICLITHHKLALSPICIHFSMFSFIPPLIGLTSAYPLPCANKNIFNNKTLNRVGCAGIVFSMLHIVATTILASSLLCVHGIGGMTLCRSGTLVMIWYIGCHPHVMCSNKEQWPFPRLPSFCWRICPLFIIVCPSIGLIGPWLFSQGICIQCTQQTLGILHPQWLDCEHVQHIQLWHSWWNLGITSISKNTQKGITLLPTTKKI